MRRPLVAACILLAGALACREPTAATAPAALVGQWVSDAEPVSPAGSYRLVFTFTSRGRFTFEVRSFGLYPGQAADALSAYERTEGTFRADGERLTFTPGALVTWDRFYGDAKPAVRTPYPYSGFYDDARYTVAGRALTLRYQGIGPADDIVAAERSFRRAD